MGKSNIDINTLTQQMYQKRWGSIGSANSSGGSKGNCYPSNFKIVKRRKLKHKINDVMKIRDMKHESKDIELVKWDGLPQSASSSRNKINCNLTHGQNERAYSKFTMNHEGGSIRLENSQELTSWFNTLAPGQYRHQLGKLNEEISKKNDETSSVKRTKKNIIKSRKYFNDRAQDVATIYKKSSLSIANFLSNYAIKGNRSVKKRRKSGRATSNTAYTFTSTKVNVRSQSNFQAPGTRGSDKQLDNDDNIINLNLTAKHPKINDSGKQSTLSEIRLKRHGDRKVVRDDHGYSNSIHRSQAYREAGGRKTCSNRGDFISTSSNSRRIIKNSHSGALASK